MSTQSTATTTREVEVSRIPSGEKITLPGGAEVVITQALGGSFTILVPSQAGLYRVEGVDADAIGQAVPEAAQTSTGEGGVEEAIWGQLRTCFDPEIPVNIVDLGLIYGLDLKPTEAGVNVVVQMTLTAPGCGMGPIIASEARQKILSVDGVQEADVELVWEPAWSPDRISEAGKQKLGII